MSNDKVKKLEEKIKVCGEYSIELDGYVINPTTVACKLSNDGYVHVEPITDLEGEIKKIVGDIWTDGARTGNEHLYPEMYIQAEVKDLATLFYKTLASLAQDMTVISDEEIDKYCEENPSCSLINVKGGREPNYMSRDCSRCNVQAQLKACQDKIIGRK
jgi:hypothetical protein